jgi:hypothetical protein
MYRPSTEVSVNKKLWLMLAIALVCTTFSVKGQAQQDVTLKCESNDEHLKQCQVPGGTRRVTLIRQISGSPCIEGRTWGFNDNYLWVDKGCRAEFRAESRGYLGGGPIFGGGSNNSGQTIRCSSDDERRQYCNADTRGGVRLVRQVSGSPCIQGQTWGYDRNGIWVDRGCRADFQLGGGSGGYWPGQGGGGSGQTIHCASNDERRQFCRVDTRGGVQLTRQVSGSPCIEGRTWGYTRDGIWVDRGCRADFQTGYGYNGGSNWPGQGNQQDVIYCASDDGRRQYCRTNNYGQIRRVRLVRQRSGSPCIEGQTWGWDQRGVWVDRGCRAEFRVRTR